MTPRGNRDPDEEVVRVETHEKSPERGPESLVTGGATASRAGDSQSTLAQMIRAFAWRYGLRLRSDQDSEELADAIADRFIVPIQNDRDRLDRDLDTALCRIAVLEGRTVATPDAC